MSTSRPLLLASLLLVFAALPGSAGEAEDATAQVLLETLRSNKKALVAVNLELSDEEATGFWPIYDRYQNELAGVQDRMLGVIDDYVEHFESMSNERALQLVGDYLAIEQDRVEVRRAFLEPISKVLPGRKVMRFYQIENKVDAVLRYQLARTIPVVEQ